MFCTLQILYTTLCIRLLPIIFCQKYCYLKTVIWETQFQKELGILTKVLGCKIIRLEPIIGHKLIQHKLIPSSGLILRCGLYLSLPTKLSRSYLDMSDPRNGVFFAQSHSNVTYPSVFCLQTQHQVPVENIKPCDKTIP